MKTKLAPKKLRQQFITKVTALLLGLGAEPLDYEFVLHTKGGRLKLHPTDNMVEGLGTVFTRFDDPRAAMQLVACNPHSGKWNFHFFDGWTVEAAIQELAFQLNTVLA
jgi:hypothetical protein